MIPNVLTETLLYQFHTLYNNISLFVHSLLQPMRQCQCRSSSSSLIGGSGAGWEGTALLHHGSYIKLGCLQFVFSIVEQAPKDPTLTPVKKEPVVNVTMAAAMATGGTSLLKSHLRTTPLSTSTS